MIRRINDMFYPTKPITFEEIITILERSWDKMTITNLSNQCVLRICQFQVMVSNNNPEHDQITISTPHRTLTFHTWFGSPYLLIDNGKESSSQNWETWFYETLKKITLFIYEKSRNLIRPLFCLIIFTFLQ